MNPLLDGNGEIDLTIDKQNVVATDGLEQWQIDQLVNPNSGDSPSYASHCLGIIDKIVRDWFQQLTKEQWDKILRQKSLFGIPLPNDWIKVWRTILKEPSLRDAEAVTRSGRGIGSFVHTWNLWAEECMQKYLDESDRELIKMVDNGYLYAEIGDWMLGKYGNSFWKKRKATSKTTPSQVVNNHLYWKLPNKIVRGELTDMVLMKLRKDGLLD